MLPSLILLVLFSLSVSDAVHPTLPNKRRATLTHRGRRNIFDRTPVTSVPAPPCNATDSPTMSPCDDARSFCCAASTDCTPSTDGTGWRCVHKSDLWSCGMSDTPCPDGVTCCPEEMVCAASGGCVQQDDEQDEDAEPFQDETDVPTPECEANQTLCLNACCTDVETCDVGTGNCMAIQPSLPSNATTSNTTQQHVSTPGNSAHFTVVGGVFWLAAALIAV